MELVLETASQARQGRVMVGVFEHDEEVEVQLQALVT